LLRPPYIPLAKVGTEAIRVEVHDEDVVELVLGRGAISLNVATAAMRDCHIAVDCNRLVVRLIGASHVAILQPALNDGRASDERLSVGVIAVDGVLGEERADLLEVIGQPGLDVGIQPPLDGRMIYVCHGSSFQFSVSAPDFEAQISLPYRLAPV